MSVPLRGVLLILLPAILLAVPVSGAAAGHCGIALGSVSRAAAAGGEEVELFGFWGDSQGEKRPTLNRGDVHPLPVLAWGREAIRVRIPAGLAPGRYKIGVYCALGGEGFSTDWLDFDVLEPGAVAPPPEGGYSGMVRPPAGVAPPLESWLAAHPRLRDALIWEGAAGPEPFLRWPQERKTALEGFFRRAWREEPTGLRDPPPNQAVLRDEQRVEEVLWAEDAEALYLATAGHSLALEAGRRLPWSLEESGEREIAIVLSGPEFFTRVAGGYRIDGNRAGTVLPPPPEVAFAFLRGMVADNRFLTITALLEWIREKVIHHEGDGSAKNFEAHWQYRGLPPATRMIRGTRHLNRPGDGIRHRTAGCGGTTGFLRALLRTVNIPVESRARFGHALPCFPTEQRCLSHGDDPYHLRAVDSPCGAAGLLITEATFRTWFDDPATARRENIGRGAEELKGGRCPPVTHGPGR